MNNTIKQATIANIALETEYNDHWEARMILAVAMGENFLALTIAGHQSAHREAGHLTEELNQARIDIDSFLNTEIDTYDNAEEIRAAL